MQPSYNLIIFWELIANKDHGLIKTCVVIYFAIRVNESSVSLGCFLGIETVSGVKKSTSFALVASKPRYNFKFLYNLK